MVAADPAIPATARLAAVSRASTPGRDELLLEQVVSSRNRRNPRGVKRKMSNFPLRRKGHKPLPTFDPANATRILK